MKQDQPIETYTFSRALHLMRYGGKKMKPINSVLDYYYSIEINSNKLRCFSNNVVRENLELISLTNIMGEWVEVK